MKKIFLLSSFLIAISTNLWALHEKAVLTLRAEPEYFSPNNDSLQDQVFLYPVLQAPAEPKRWWMDIIDTAGKNHNRFSGNGLPALFKWDGFDKKGLPVSDGNYIAEFHVTGPGYKLATRYQLHADTKPPQAALSVSSAVLDSSFLQKGSFSFYPNAQDASPIDRWQVQIIDSSGRTLQVFWSTGPIKDVQWNGVDRATGVLAPPGPYRAAFVAWDRAGNESPPAFADFSVQVTVREMLQQNLSQIQIIETPIGLLVQLSAEDLFNLKLKKPTLTEKGGRMLRDVGILVNAYPEIPVTIEGYSKTKKAQAVTDRDKASYYGWNVYSYLVKVGHVKASRLSVRGRGRSALFSRRGVAVPFTRNGVEVILEGNREW